jgi:hypothetical protein
LLLSNQDNTKRCYSGKKLDLFDTSFSGGFGELVDPSALAKDERALGHDYLTRALREDAIAAGLQRDDGAHGLPGWVEGVNLGKGGVRMGLPDLSVVLAQVHDEAQQGTFRLVADLRRQLVRIFWELDDKKSEISIVAGTGW